MDKGRFEFEQVNESTRLFRVNGAEYAATKNKNYFTSGSHWVLHRRLDGSRRELVSTYVRWSDLVAHSKVNFRIFDSWGN